MTNSHEYRDGLATVLAAVLVANQKTFTEDVLKTRIIFDKLLRRITVINSQFPQERVYILLVFLLFIHSFIYLFISSFHSTIQPFNHSINQFQSISINHV